MNEVLRPTKKQRELLEFIEQFIAEHGYSPSYREIMSGLQYNSVATVALHVGNLIERGQLRKRNRSARSLEVVKSNDISKLTTNQVNPNEEKWLVDKVEHFFRQAEQASEITQSNIDELYVLISTLKILSLDGAAESFLPRFSVLKARIPQ